MTDESIRQQLDAEVEYLSINQLNELGNQAIALGLIAGHGHHQGQYEILRQGEVLLMTPQEALPYLQTLIQTATEGD